MRRAYHRARKVDENLGTMGISQSSGIIQINLLGGRKVENHCRKPHEYAGSV